MRHYYILNVFMTKECFASNANYFMTTFITTEFSISLFKELIGALLAISLVYLLIAIPFKGLMYENARKRIDSKYKEKLFFFFRNGKITSPIPFPVSYKTENEEVKKTMKTFNSYVYLFWILLIITLITFYI